MAWTIRGPSEAISWSATGPATLSLEGVLGGPAEALHGPPLADFPRLEPAPHWGPDQDQRSP